MKIVKIIMSFFFWLFFSLGASAEIKIIRIEGINKCPNWSHYAAIALKGYNIGFEYNDQERVACKIWSIMEPDGPDAKQMMAVGFKDFPEFLQKINESGLKASDIIVTVNGQYMKSCQDIPNIIKENGNSVEFGVWVEEPKEVKGSNSKEIDGHNITLLSFMAGQEIKVLLNVDGEIIQVQPGDNILNGQFELQFDNHKFYIKNTSTNERTLLSTP